MSFVILYLLMCAAFVLGYWVGTWQPKEAKRRVRK